MITTASLRRATNRNGLVTGRGLAGLRRHDLRHTGATWMADAGVPLHVLREILRHRSLETTRGHLHADTRHLTDAAMAVNAFLSASGAKLVTRTVRRFGLSTDDARPKKGSPPAV